MVSVIIPVHNGEAYLGEAIQSVLVQTLPADELIVIDDGSTDGTAAEAQRYGAKLRYVRQPHAGPGAARDHGIRIAKGDYLAFLDADDLWAPRKLELQMRAFEEEPELDLVFGHMDQFRSPELAPDVAATLVCNEVPTPSPLISCLLARRSAFDRVGALRTDLKNDFVDWYVRARDAGLRMRTLGELVSRRRMHPGNFTRRNKDLRQEYLHLLKMSLDRRRSRQDGG